MANDLPPWNYWMWDDKGEYIYKYDYGMADHPDAEFLWGTEWDEKWVQTFFWTAEQATALSFGRSPDKVTWDDEPFGVKDMEGSSEFASYFCMLRDGILEAQSKGILPSSIPALMYIEWTEKNDIPFPPSLAASIVAYHKTITDDAQRFVRLEKLVQQQGEEILQLQQELSLEREREKADAALNPRLRDNLLRVVLGVAKDKYQYSRPGAAKRISDALLEHEISLSEDTILGYLKQADDLP
jgi:hypothetical protein